MTVTELFDFRECAILAPLIESLRGADVVSFPAQFALRCRRSRALLTWTGSRVGSYSFESR